MPLPNSVAIGPYVYAVHDDQAAYLEAVVEGKEDCYGWIKHAKSIIILDPNQADQHKRVTLLHEILHGCWHVTDREHKNDEDPIRMLAAPLLDVLRRNPDLVAYLTED